MIGTHVACLPNSEKPDPNAQNQSESQFSIFRHEHYFLSANREAYICSFECHVHFIFQPQNNYKQISLKSVLFSSTRSHAKQLAPGLTILNPKHQPYMSNYITCSAANREAYIC